MKMFDAIYKCRLCGEEFVECSTSGEEKQSQLCNENYVQSG